MYFVMDAIYESFKENNLHMTNFTNYEWEKMSFNSGFHSMLVDNEMKNDLVGLFAGVENFLYLSKMRNLNQTPYSETKEKAKFTLPIA